ncbi:MAG: ribosome-associated translation inhibitor RaiA [Bacteroidales bacterium]|nr:ribosome-associated translation inhibitor RaiA [Bacteroidales bacterium]
MNVKVQSVRFDADKKLLDYVEQKVGKLSQMSDNILSAEVILRLDNSETNENKIAEVSLNVPKITDLFAKRQCKTFEEAVDLSVDALKKQLLKAKEKQRD